MEQLALGNKSTRAGAGLPEGFMNSWKRALLGDGLSGDHFRGKNKSSPSITARASRADRKALPPHAFQAHREPALPSHADRRAGACFSPGEACGQKHHLRPASARRGPARRPGAPCSFLF